MQYFTSTADNFNVSPDEIVEPTDARATISCLYTPLPTIQLQWGVGRSGSYQLISDNSSNLKISLDSRSLIFDPVTRGQEGNYYCWLPLSQTENEYSRVVPFTILGKSLSRQYNN